MYERGAQFTLVGSDGTTLVFNDGVSGLYLEDVSGFDSPTIRTSVDDLPEYDGALAGNSYLGQRPVTLTGKIGELSAANRNLRITSLQRALRGLRGDFTLSSTATGLPAMQTKGRVVGLKVSGGPYTYLNVTISGATAGRVYTDSAWVYADPSSVGDNCVLYLFAFGGAFATENATPLIVTLVPGWQRLVVTYTIVQNDRTAIQLIVQGGNAFDPGDTFWVDGVQLEGGSRAHTYVETAGSAATGAEVSVAAGNAGNFSSPPVLTITGPITNPMVALMSENRIVNPRAAAVNTDNWVKEEAGDTLAAFTPGIVSPYGGPNAFVLTEGSSNTITRAWQYVNEYTPGATYTVSALLRYGASGDTARTVRLGVYDLTAAAWLTPAAPFLLAGATWDTWVDKAFTYTAPVAGHTLQVYWGSEGGAAPGTQIIGTAFQLVEGPRQAYTDIGNELAAIALNGISLAAGETLTVDVAARTVLKSDGTNWYGAVRFPLSSWWELPPGNSTVTLSGTGTSAATQLSVSSRDAWT